MSGDESFGGLEPILDEMHAAWEAQLGYAALSTALAIPDICSSLLAEVPSNRSDVGTTYMKWVEDNVVPIFDKLSGEDCWSIRNGVFHNGVIGNRHLAYDNAVLWYEHTYAEQKGDIYHNGVRVSGKTKFVSLPRFLQAMHQAAEQWYLLNQFDRQLIVNSDNLITKGTGGYYIAPGVRVGFSDYIASKKIVRQI